MMKKEVRTIDNLGRIFIPKEIRMNLGIKESEKLKIEVKGESIVLSKDKNDETREYSLPKVIRKRLFELRKTQRWLAEQIGTTEVSVSRYVSGDRKPKVDVAFKIANALEITIDDLVFGESERINDKQTRTNN